MHIDPLLPPLLGVVLSVLLLGLTLRRLGQPEIIGYLIAGALIGPHGFAWLTDAATIEHLGTLGVTLLLFFIGMEVSPTKLVQGWRVALVGTLLQILASVSLAWLIGLWFDWPLSRVVLLGFVISLSSTAVVLKLLKDNGELDSPCGRDVLMVLLAQDLAIVPMLILLSLLGGKLPATETLALQGVGAVLVVGLGGWLATRERIHIPLLHWVRGDREFQVFAALLICFGFAFVTGLLQLSTALGAFVGGMLVASARETEWVHHSLEPFRTLFVALFFVSVGLLIDPEFIAEHWLQIGLLVLAVLLSNTFVNALVLRALRVGWHQSLLSGAMLAQIGEFSFVLAAAGLQAAIISEYAYQTTVAVIAISLILSAPWIALVRRLTTGPVG